jgi:Domain of unknown function (DUF4189)
MQVSRVLARAISCVAPLGFLILGAVAPASGAEFRCGAIALSFKDNKHFGATRYATCEEAERVVMKACQERAKGECKAITCRNSCCALATGPKGTGSNVASSQRDAARAALASCGQYGPSCRIVRSHCNFGDPKTID